MARIDLNHVVHVLYTANLLAIEAWEACRCCFPNDKVGGVTETGSISVDVGICGLEPLFSSPDPSINRRRDATAVHAGFTYGVGKVYVEEFAFAAIGQRLIDYVKRAVGSALYLEDGHTTAVANVIVCLDHLVIHRHPAKTTFAGRGRRKADKVVPLLGFGCTGSIAVRCCGLYVGYSTNEEYLRLQRAGRNHNLVSEVGNNRHGVDSRRKVLCYSACCQQCSAYTEKHPLHENTCVMVVEKVCVVQCTQTYPTGVTAS